MSKFSFGKNWQDFLKSLNEERFDTAKNSLQELLDLGDLRGKSFLDAGCGSGLFSFAAYQLGAKEIISFDVDPFSVECAKYLHKEAGNPQNWKIYQGSVLDKDFLKKLNRSDIVYAWGSLHHTGNMWQAIKNSAELVDRGGLFAFAIYNKVMTRYGSNFWLKIKKLYNNAPDIFKPMMELPYMSKLMAYYIVKGKNPAKILKDFKKKRGMSWRHDIIDWLGGYPYEFATVEEIFKFIKKEYPDFILTNVKTTNGLGNNQFVFKRS